MNHNSRCPVMGGDLCAHQSHLKGPGCPQEAPGSARETICSQLCHQWGKSTASTAMTSLLAVDRCWNLLSSISPVEVLLSVGLDGPVWALLFLVSLPNERTEKETQPEEL